MRNIGIFSDKEPPPMNPVQFEGSKPLFVDDDDNTFTVNTPYTMAGLMPSPTARPLPTPPPKEPKTPEPPRRLPRTPEPRRRKKEPPPIDHKLQLRKALKPLLEAGYTTLDNAESVAIMYGYLLDRSLSTENTYVYISIRTGFPLVVHRGSVSASDWWLEDMLIATGITSAFNSSPRLAQAREITARTERKYGKPADAFGHSLGGRIAEYSGANGFIMTYNKATGLFDARAKVGANQIDYRSPKDIVSLISEVQRRDSHIRHIKDTGLMNSHSVSSLPEVAGERRR